MQSNSLIKGSLGGTKASTAFAVAAMIVGYTVHDAHAQTNNAPINNPASNFSTQLHGGVPNQHQNVFATSTTPRPSTDSFENWLWNSPTMTGDWGGARTKLKNMGINIFANYASQLGSNVSGGKKIGTAYTQQVSLGVDWDLQKLMGWRGGLFHTYIESRAGGGKGLEADYIGSNIQANGTYGSGENFRLPWKLKPMFQM